MASRPPFWSDSACPRSSNRSRKGVLFVHGVGSAGHSDTLIDFGQSFAGWVTRWQRAQHREPDFRAAALNFTPYDAGSDHPIPCAELKIPRDPREDMDTTWVCAEAWYASSVRPMPFSQMLWWSLRYLGTLIAHLMSTTIHVPQRLPESNRSIHDGGRWYRVIDALTAILHLFGYLFVGIAGYALLIPIIVMAQIPYEPFQKFMLVTLFQAFLQYNASELRVYIEDEIQAANLRRRVAEGVGWLTTPAEDGGGDCESVTIVAHSGGAWVAHGMLTDETYAWARDRVRKFITLGCGLSKVWELAPASIERLYKPVEGNIYWLDFWASYDPVPAGWMQPPRIGPRLNPFQKDTRAWQCIYKPNPDLARDHGMQKRADPKPPFEPLDPRSGLSRRVNYSPPDSEAVYWPDSVRVINRMDALTDHGGYFSNDEEVLRRVASEIQSDLYQDSMFWRDQPRVLTEAIRRRRDRVAFLAGARVLAIVVGAVAAFLWGVHVASYLVDVGPVSAVLSSAREMLRLIGTLPLVGPALAVVWLALVVLVLWAVGALISSLVALIPFEVFRAIWEANDAGQRQALLRQVPFGWERFDAEYDGRTHVVFKMGHGPAVIVMHEIYGFTAEVESLARAIAERGFSVYVPRLFGDMYQTATPTYLVRCVAEACISREFTMFSTGKTSPIASWLRKLAERAQSECDDEAKGWHGVGVIGLCFSGGFALAMATETAVLAPVTSEPALPFAFPFSRPKVSADVGLDPKDLEALENRTRNGLVVRGYRFTCDRLSPEARFQTLRNRLGANFIACEISSDPGNEWNIPQTAHAVLTGDRDPRPDHPTAKALEQILTFLDSRLKKSA